MEVNKIKSPQINQNGYHKNTLTKERIGTLFLYPIDYTPDDCLACDGYSLQIVDYEDLYKVIGTQFNQSDDVAGTFRVPDYNITKRFLQPGSGAGIQVEAGLPNITGEFGKTETISNDSYGKGAFTVVYEGQCGDANAGATRLYHWTFSASNSNFIYGNSTTVQPPSQLVHICIKYK